MASEIPEIFNLKQNLKLGMLSLVLDSQNSIGKLKAYITLYMQEEVQQEGLVRKIEQFSQFLEVISFSQGSTLNYSNIARECYISNKTVENYVRILEDSLLSFRLSVFEKRARRELSKSQKFYFFDCGVFQTIRPLGPLDSTLEMGGQALETLVAQHLMAWIHYSNRNSKLYYWRTHGGLELDFVVYGEIGFYVLEVKSTTNPNPKDLRALKEFKKDYPEATCYLLYQGLQRTIIDGITCIPIETFLLKLKPNMEI